MKTVITIAFCLLLVLTGSAWAQETMTPAVFKKLVEAPGDSTPLNSKLASLPLWSGAVCSNYMKYADGHVFTEECPATLKTVQGRYLVYTMNSRYYKQPMHGILTYDEKSQAYKEWGLFGTNLTEAIGVFDFDKSASAWTGRYAGGLMEISVGTFSTDQTSEHSLTYKDGVLFLTRHSVTRPVKNPAGESGGSQSGQQRAKP